MKKNESISSLDLGVADKRRQWSLPALCFLFGFLIIVYLCRSPLEIQKRPAPLSSGVAR